MSKKFKILVRKFEPFERIVDIFWNKYRQKSATKLELEAIALDLPELHAAILSGYFDVAHVNTDWLAQCNKLNNLENLAPYIKSSPPEDYPNDWTKVHLSLQTFEDTVLGIPFHDGPECLIYRKDLFNDKIEKENYEKLYKCELKPPETWDEFVRIADFFNRPEKGMYGTLFALYPDGHNNVFDFGLQVWSRGGSLVNEQGHIMVYSPEAVEAMEFYRSLINEPFVHPKSRDLESISACWTFAKGEAAMMVNWFGFATVCETDKNSNVKGCIDICSVPHAASFNEPISLSVYYTWSVSSKSQNKQESYNFIRNSVSKENDAILPFEGAISCRRSTWFNPKINKIIPYYNRLDKIHEYVRTLPRTPEWHDVSKVIDGLVLDVINTEKSVDLILNEAQSRIDNI